MRSLHRYRSLPLVQKAVELDPRDGDLALRSLGRAIEGWSMHGRVVDDYGVFSLGVDTVVQRINAEVNRMRRDLGKYACATHDLPGRSAEGGEVRTCSDERGVRFADVVLLGETGQVREQYDFTLGGELIQVTRTEETYSVPMSGRVRARTDEDFLFKDRKLVRWSDRGRGVRPLATAKVQAWAKQLVAFADSVAGMAALPRRAEP